jgi:hypothetical protein
VTQLKFERRASEIVPENRQGCQTGNHNPWRCTMELFAFYAAVAAYAFFFGRWRRWPM